MTVELKEPINVRDLYEGTTFEVHEALDEQWDASEAREFYEKYPANDLKLSDLILENFESVASQLIDMTGDKKIQKLILSHGSGRNVGDAPKVRVHYAAHWSEDPFDSTYMSSGRPRCLKTDDMIEGFRIAVSSMKQQEKSIFLIDPIYGFGDLGCGSRIPGGVTLYYQIEVVEIIDNIVEDFSTLSSEERASAPYKMVKDYTADMTAKGKALFESKQYGLARKKYSQLVDCLDDYHTKHDGERKEVEGNKFRAFLNIAVCSNKLGRSRETIRNANLAFRTGKDFRPDLLDDKHNARIKYLQGKANQSLHQFDAARVLFQKASELAPNDPSIRRALSELDKNMKRSAELEKSFCKLAFQSSESNAEASSSQPENELTHARSRVSDDFAELIDVQLKSLHEDADISELPLIGIKLNDAEKQYTRLVATSYDMMVNESQTDAGMTLRFVKKDGCVQGGDSILDETEEN